jgi:hypothetical protein
MGRSLQRVTGEVLVVVAPRSGSTLPFVAPAEREIQIYAGRSGGLSVTSTDGDGRVLPLGTP